MHSLKLTRLPARRAQKAALSSLALALLLGPGAGRSAHAAQKSNPTGKPNVLIILPDQWRAQAFGFAGDPNVKTPHLDRLANQSVRFANAVSGVPVCCPARASLLTGQRPLTTGVFLNDVELNPAAVTLAKVLREAGYDTGYIGKWHLNGDGRSRFIPRERRQGFDYWRAAECTHDYNHSSYYADGPQKLTWQGYDAIAQTHDALQYLQAHAASDKPFFLVLAWGPPHDPYSTAPEKYRALYAPASLKLAANIPASLTNTARELLAGYYAHCTALDDCFGVLWSALEQTGLDQNTLLVFTSDHGDLLGAHGSRNKQQPYDECLRVPLLVHWPAGLGTRPRKRDALINSEDIMPTILGLCRIPIPSTVEGLDFSAYLRGGRNPSGGAALISCVAPFGQWTRKVGGREYRGVRTLRYTYVRDLSGPWLLFDNRNDPLQQRNLVGLPAFTKLQTSLEARLQQKLAQTHDQFLSADTYIRQWGYQVDKEGTVPYEP